jgi:hypothetical protein
MTALTPVTDLAQRQPWLVALASFFLGLIIGLPVLGWWLFPVQWTNASFADLHSDFKQEYVRLVANNYAYDFDAVAAARRVSALGPNASTVVSDTIASSQGRDAIAVSQLKQVIDASGAVAPPVTTRPSLLARLQLPLLACGVVLLLGLLGGFLYMRMMGTPRVGRPMASRPTASYGRMAPTMETEAAGAPVGVATPTGAPPVARFMTTYTLGDDVYDDSFSVDGPDGNFLGECGMGISETIGVGDPKKVTAFEVWLFDKNDIRTVTKVLMSEHAFRDEALKSRLAAKGEPVQAMPGDTVTLETATLIVTARVVDMAYGGGALPPNSFFERITIELAAFKKPNGA